MPETEECRRFYRWGPPKSTRKGAPTIPREWKGDLAPGHVEYAEWGHGNDPLDIEASRIIDTLLGRHGSLGHLLWAQQSAKIAAHSEVALVRLRAELLRSEFEALAEEWRRDTQHLSQISKKVAHPAYFRIMGMGEAVVPLLLEALRDRPAHWFAALQATANTNPSPDGASPSKAREAWLDWGRASGLVD